MESMADLMRKLGWIAWCLTVIGWFLSPIINFLMNKIFVYMEFDTSRKLKELENDTIPKLKQTLSDMEEQTVLRAAQDKGSQCDLKILYTLMKDLKSALYEAEDILDLLDYRRIEKDLHLADDASVWVENQLSAASAWIACCKGSWFGRCIEVIRAGVMKGAQSMTQLEQFLIQRWQHSRQDFDLFCIHRAINITGAAVLQYAHSWYQQLGQLIRCVLLRRSGALLPVSRPVLKPPCRPAEEMVNDEELMEETEVEEGEAEEIQDGEDGAMIEEMEEEICEREVGEMSEEEIEEERYEGEVGLTPSEEEIEDDEERKEGELTSLSVFLCCARSMLTWFAKACFYRDWSYGIVGIKSEKEDGSVAELVPITERISLMNQIKRIEDILTDSKKSDLLNDKNSSSGTAQNADNESSSKKNEIDDLYRSIMQEQTVIGREEDRACISRMLRERTVAYPGTTQASKSYSVIGIYGIPGSGKSTLAQYVSDYEKGQAHFNLIMFIHVGKTFSVGDIFRDMLDQIKQQQASDTEDPNESQTTELHLRRLKAELEKELQNKCFLLVLDELWVNVHNMKEPLILLHVLDAGQSGSRILVTAQNKEAAAALGAHEQMQIPIPDLEEEQYLSMFMYYALEVSQVTSTDYNTYMEIGRKITKKLRRSPIAARTVAARLKSDNSIGFWETTANLDMLNETMGALWWSYQQLGVDIRRCFAYCCTFPRGYGLTRVELVRIWIAQGFVSTRCNATEELEDIGQSYIDQLLSFSFLQLQVQPKTIFHEETVECKIHDMLRELVERVSGSEFLRIGLDGSPKDISRGVRHVFIETNNAAEFISKILDMGNLRTLIVKEPYAWTTVINHDIEKVLESLFTRLTKLRVLIIKQNCCLLDFSVSSFIYQMKHLRYLGFHFQYYRMILPSTFSKLYHIQTIEAASLKFCPEDMANLISLGHVSDPLSCPNIGRLTSLQTLTLFRVEAEQGYGLEQLKHLNKLRGTLTIQNLVLVKSKEEALQAQLGKKKGLRILKLDFKNYYTWDERIQVDPDVQAEVLESLCAPKNVVELSICNYMGSRYPTWLTSHQDAPKHLRILKLYACSQLASIPEDSELFIDLCELKIQNCDWDRLPQNIDVLVSLQTLELWECNEMELLPNLPQSLKKIQIFHCLVLSKTCKEGEHENWHKIKYIPEKDIR